MENSGSSILGNNKIAADPIRAKQCNINNNNIQKTINNLANSAEDTLKQAALNVSK
jgi:hypothetical protein